MEAWAPWFGAAGTFFVGIINFTPIPGFITLWKTKDIRLIPHMFFLLNNLNTLLWLSMGIANNLPDVVRSNTLGFAFTTSYLLIYHIVKGDVFSFAPVYLSILTAIFYSLTNYVPPDYITAIAGVNNTLMALSPLQQVKLVLKEQDSKFIDLYIMSIALPTSFCWMMFGLCIGKIPMVIPNAIGVISCSILIILKFIYMKPKAKQT